MRGDRGVRRAIGAGAVAVLLVSCGSDGDSDGGDAVDDPSGDVTVPADATVPNGGDPSGGSSATIDVFGTTAAAPVDGFTAYDSNCETAFTSDEPGFGDVDVQLPRDWTVVGVSGDSGLRFTTEGAERTLEVGISENSGPLDLAAIAEAAGGGDEVGTITWGGESYPVLFDGMVFRVYAPALSLNAPSLPELNYVFEARFGSSGSGDTTAFGEENILAVLDSMSLNDCVIDEYLLVFPDAEVTVVS
jgi:hypothetical protein